MKLRKIVCLIMLFAVALSQLSLPVNAEGKPTLEITNIEIPKGGAGRTIDIPITIKNNSNFFSKDIKITPDLSADDNPFLIEQLNLTKVIKKLSADKSESIKYTFKIDKNAKAKLYPLKLKFEFKNAYDTSYTEVKTIYVNVVDVHIPTKLVVNDVITTPKMAIAGENVDVAVKIKNTGTLAANNVTISMKENENFSIVDSVTDKNVYSIQGISTKIVNYTLRPKKELKSGTYKIDLELKYIDNKNEEVKREQGIYVQVSKGTEEEESDSKLKIDNIVSPTGEVNYQNKFNIKFNLTNEGIGTAKNVRVSMVSEDANVFPISQSKFILGDMAGKKKTPLSFTFSSTNEVKTKNYPIKVVVEYDMKKDDKVTTQSIEQFVGVLIKEKPDDTDKKTSVPKVIISNYYTDPAKIVRAGENYTLHMVFQNTNKTKAVKNMKVTLRPRGSEKNQTTGSSDNVFTPQESSNIFYVDELGPNKTTEQTMVMYTLPDAMAKTYPIEIEFDYEYEQAGEVKSNQMTNEIGIHVVQPAKLEIGQIQPPMEVYVGEPAELGVEFYNTGKVNLANLMVKTEGDFDVRDGNYFVGTFQMGNTESYYPYLVAKEVGEKKGKVIFTYEDATGKEQVVEQEFAINVMEKVEEDSMNEGMMKDMENMPKPEEEKGSNLLLYIGIGAGCLILLIVIIVIVKKRKRKGMTFDEDI